MNQHRTIRVHCASLNFDETRAVDSAFEKKLKMNRCHGYLDCSSSFVLNFAPKEREKERKGGRNAEELLEKLEIIGLARPTPFYLFIFSSSHNGTVTSRRTAEATGFRNFLRCFFFFQVSASARESAMTFRVGIG